VSETFWVIRDELSKAVVGVLPGTDYPTAAAAMAALGGLADHYSAVSTPRNELTPRMRSVLRECQPPVCPYCDYPIDNPSQSVPSTFGPAHPACAAMVR